MGFDEVFEQMCSDELPPAEEAAGNDQQRSLPHSFGGSRPDPALQDKHESLPSEVELTSANVCTMLPA